MPRLKAIWLLFPRDSVKINVYLTAKENTMLLGTFRSALGLLACGLALSPGAGWTQQAPAKPASRPVDFSQDRTL